MRSRFGFLVGFGAGYVLGAKAGHERYEQIKRLYENILASPGIRQATGKAKNAASSGFEQAKDKASEGATKAKEAIRERRAEEKRTGSLTVAPPPQ